MGNSSGEKRTHGDVDIRLERGRLAPPDNQELSHKYPAGRLRVLFIWLPPPFIPALITRTHHVFLRALRTECVPGPLYWCPRRPIDQFGRCVLGVRHEGTPEGKYEEINGIKTYVATPSKDYPKDKAVIYICDIFGLELPNNVVGQLNGAAA